MFWHRLLGKTPFGSIAYWTMTHDPMVNVYRLPWSPERGVIGSGRAATIASFSPEVVLENRI
jgi:hypothetical protein